MPCRLLLRPTAVVLACLLAWTLGVRAAAPIKEWKDGTNGKATDKDNWKDGAKPGNSDVARISNGKVIVDEPATAPLTILGLELSGTGALEGGGTLSLLGLSGVLSADSSWTGGDINNVTLNTSTATTFTIGAGATKNLKNGAKLNLLGNTTWSGGDVSTANGAQIANTGNFTVTGGGKIGHDSSATGSRATFTNNGTFTKNTAADLTELESVFNNNANVTVSTGTLKLKGGGTHASSGNITVATNATLAISDHDYTFNGGAIAGSGTLEFAGATTTFNGTSAANAHLKVNGGTARFNQSHSTSGRLTLSSGAIDGASGTTTTVGGLDWTGGDITTTKVTTTGTNTIGHGSTKRLLNSAQLTLGGNTLWDGSTIETADATTILNQNGVTFSASGDGSLVYNGTGTRAVFTNNGTFTKDAGGTTGTEVQTKFDNNGAVNANGRLRLVGGGTSTGSFNIASGATVTIADNNYTFNGGTLTGGGTIDIVSATATFNGTHGSAHLKVNGGHARFDGDHATTGTLTLANGNVSGAGHATVGGLDWQSGTLDSKVTASGGTFAAGSKTLGSAADLTLLGNTTWDGSTLHAHGNGKIKNSANATFTVSADGDFTNGGSAVFTNNGTFEKTAGNTTATNLALRFESDGEIKAHTGTLKFSGGGRSSNNITLGTDATVEILGADFEISGGAINGSSGKLRLTDKTTTFKNATSGSAEISIASASATAKFDGTHTGSGKLSLSAGTVTGDGTAEFGSLQFTGGTLAGTIKSNGATTLGGGAKTVSGELTLGGDTSWDSSALHADGSGKIKNNATFTARGDGALTSSGNASFVNSGTFEKATTTGGSTDIYAAFENTGEIKATAGKLKLLGGGSSSNAVTLGDGATLEIAGANYAFTGGAINGANGKLQLSGATTTFTNTTSGSAELLVSGSSATAKFDGTHTGSGKLSLSSGAITGTGTAEFATLDWSGGSLGAKVKSNGHTVIGGSNAKTLAGGELTLAGNTTWDGSALHAANSAKIKNELGHTFTASADGALTTDGTATFTNAGIFEKTAGSGAATDIQSRFESSGTIKATAGTLKLSGGGHSSNTVTIGNGAKLEISGANFAFNGGAINGSSGKLELSGATTSFTGSTSGDAELLVSNSAATARFDGTHTGSGKLSLTSGSVTGTGTAEFATLEWSGGSLGAKVKSNGHTVIGGSNAKTLAGGELTLGGDTTWNGSALHASGSAKIKNEAGRTFTASADGALTTDGTATFTNAGTFEKNGGAGGMTNLQARFENTGHLKATTGTLKLSGGGSSSSNVTIGNGAKLEISGANFAFNGGAINGSSGKLELSGATTSFTNTTSGSAELLVSGSSATAKFDGTHTGSGKLSLTSGAVTGTGTAEFATLDWSGGSLGAKVKSNGHTVIGGSNAKTLAGGELTLGGNTTWDGSALHAANSAKIKNELGHTFTASADGALTTDGTATFTNAGTFEKNGGAGGMTNLQARFENTGHLKATTGTLKLSGGGSSSSNVTIGPGAQLEIFGADFAFTGGAINGSSGKLKLSGNTTTFTNATSGDAELSLSGAATARFDGTHTGTGKLNLASGTVAGSGTAEFGTLDWSGGSLNAKVKTNGHTTLTGGLKVLGGELTLDGNTTWDGSSLHASHNGKIKNESARTFSITGDGTLSTDGTATITNAGTFEKTAGSGGATHLHARLDSPGTLRVADGTLRLLGGGGASGNVALGASGKLQIFGANYAFENAAFSGNGTLELDGATTRFKGNSGSVKLSLSGGNADLDTSELAASQLLLAHGSVNSLNGGSADVGSLAWSGGTLNAKVKAAGATLTGSNKTLSSGADLTLGGLTTWDGSLIQAHGNARVRNAASATFQATDGLFANFGTALFANDGTLTKSQGNGSLVFQTRFENNGTVNVDSGKLHLTGGGRNADHASILVRAASELLINGDLELAANSELNGEGLGRLLSGTLTAHGHVRLKNFSFEGGSLAGSNTFHGAVDWHGGNWNSDVAGAITTIAAGGSLNLRGHSHHDFANRSIFNYGIVNWHSGHLRGGNGSAFVNHSVFNDLNASTKSLSISAGTASFANHGEYRKSGAGTTEVDVPFTNHGTIKISAGSLVFNSTFTNNGALNVTNGASAKFSSPLTFAVNAPLTGVGTIDAPLVTAAGQVAPGVSPGALAITGNLTLLNTSTLLIELGGPGQGTGYDFLSVGGLATLDGSLHVSFLNGYQWDLPAGATFTILTANAGLTGAFANVANGGRLATIDGAATFQVNYGLGASLANSVVLSNFIVAVPEPSTYALLALGSLVVLFSVRRRHKK